MKQKRIKRPYFQTVDEAFYLEEILEKKKKKQKLKMSHQMIALAAISFSGFIAALLNTSSIFATSWMAFICIASITMFFKFKKLEKAATAEKVTQKMTGKMTAGTPIEIKIDGATIGTLTDFSRQKN